MLNTPIHKYPRFFSIAIVVFTCLFLSTYSQAQDVKIDQRLAEIEKLNDKGPALKELRQLENIEDISPKQKISILLLLGSSHSDLREHKKAVEYTKKALLLAQKNNLKHKQADLYYELSILQYNAENYQEAVIAGRIALSYFQAINSPMKQAHILERLKL